MPIVVPMKTVLNTVLGVLVVCVPAEGGPSDEDMERARRRAKTRVRKLVKELVPNHFTTFTIQSLGRSITRQRIEAHLGALCALFASGRRDFQYVSVLERHPTNPDHLHMHVAWRGEGFVNYNMLRRFWHMAIGKRAGVVVKKVLRGPDSLGNVQDRQIKASAGSYRHTEKIAKYIGKYITKDLISEFNKNATGSPPAYRLRRRRCTGCLLCRCLRL